MNLIFTELVPKRLGLLHELVPKAATIGALVNPNYPDVDLQRRELQEAAVAIGQRIHVTAGSNPTSTPYSALVKQKTDALLVGNDPFFEGRDDQTVILAARHAIPAINSGREYVVAGGLMSYGPTTPRTHTSGHSIVSFDEAVRLEQ